MSGKRMRLAGVALVAVLGATVWAAGETKVKEDETKVKVGQQAPEIKARKWFNTQVAPSLAMLRGRIVVVEFWATWCPPCRKSIPHLNALHNRYKDKGVVILGLSDEGADKVQPFIREMNKTEKDMEYPVGAGSKDLAAYGVTGIPCAFLLDAQGKVIWVGHPMSGLDQAIANVLKVPAAKAGPSAPATK